MQETQETWVQSLSQEDPLEEEMATCSSVLAWEIPWASPGGIPPPGPSGELVRHKVAVRTLVRLLTNPSVFFLSFLFFLMGTQGGVHACGRLVTMD